MSAFWFWSRTSKVIMAAFLIWKCISMQTNEACTILHDLGFNTNSMTRSAKCSSNSWRETGRKSWQFTTSTITDTSGPCSHFDKDDQMHIYIHRHKCICISTQIICCFIRFSRLRAPTLRSPHHFGNTAFYTPTFIQKILSDSREESL